MKNPCLVISSFLVLASVAVPTALGQSQSLGNSYCYGDQDMTGSTYCPCNNFGSTHHGCANATQSPTHLIGAVLNASSATGTAKISSDTVSLSVDGMLANVPCVLVESTAQITNGAGFPGGDGLLCVGGVGHPISPIKKMHADSMGQVTYPGSGDAPLSVAGNATSGQTLYYQVFYRNVSQSWCLGSYTNTTPGIGITWVP
jgi:hypothetical protein